MTARWLTALVGVPLLLGLLIIGGPAWGAFIVVLIILSGLELGNLYARIGVPDTTLWMCLGGLFIFFITYTYTRDSHALFPWYVLIGLIILVALAKEVMSRQHRPLQRAGAVCLGSLYLGLYAFLYLIRANGLSLALVAIIGTWATDTLAFFIGRAIGKHPLAPTISPKKTREGAMAGLVGGMSAGACIAFFASWPIWHGFLFGLGVAIGSQMGDLVESAMKREAGVKDSGSLLPGHGGVLDRFDSLLFAGATVYYLQLLL
ncbi:MAG TPA: phosphatidate cytidylyltransferase [Firmicutes bacterium]|jgi:phosphatidate cytidylyltransferase|nr:phosphatidate cytidylyltransferase [Bacillota bacterium]